jgi:hypothetical protein
VSEVDREPKPTEIGSRYAVQEKLGQGGMAIVYRVCDRVTGQELALKQFAYRDENARQRLMLSFEREFQTLTSLAHPRIVKVFEYGLHEQTPYYTMELLAGDDLSMVAPFDWRIACSLLRDVASALAMVHSRRLLHRDVSARNVRRMADGRAKLIDFGALTPMGIAMTVIGTPPFVSPEALNRQPLDGRADLFSLGALLYWLLTGRQAFPARRLQDLPDCWRSAPEAPSALVKDVPASLSALTLSLLSVDVLGRPTTAWEVIDRLSAIAELPTDQELGTARAYLVTPTLIGREHELMRAREKLAQSLLGRGGAMWIKAGAGVGRSRLLSSIAMEARLLGLTVLRAEGAESHPGELGVVRALICELLAASGRATIPADVARVLHAAEAVERTGPQKQELADSRHAIVQWLLDQTRRHGLLIAIDDVHRADPLSAAVLGELLQASSRHKLVMALTLCPDGNPEAEHWASMLRQNGATEFMPQPLTAEQTEDLMRSVFGDAPDLRALSQFIHNLGGGNPGMTMGLCQHLLDSRALRYESGRWVLPHDPHALGIPDDIRQALSLRLSTLSEAARELAQALSLVDRSFPIAVEHYHLLLGAETPKQELHAALDELVAADLLRERGEACVFSHPALADAFGQGLSPERARPLHLRLAAIYEHERYRNIVMVAWHLQQAGEHERATELLVTRIRARDGSHKLAEKRDTHERAKWAYLAALEHCERAGAPPRNAVHLRRALANMAYSYDRRLVKYAPPVIEQLEKDIGLVYLAEFAHIEDKAARIGKCMERAKQHYDALPEHERSMDPGEAVRMLAHLVQMLAGAYGLMLDAAALRELSPLIEPLRPLSPLMAIRSEIVAASVGGTSGLESRARFAALIQRINGQAALRDTVFKLSGVTALQYYLGAFEALHGRLRALELADEIDRLTAEAEAEVGAGGFALERYRGLFVRWLAHLSRGDCEQAKLCRERIELVQLEGSDPLVGANLRASAYYLVWAHAMTGSLAELKHTVDMMVGVAEESRSWSLVLRWAHGECHKARGDLSSARRELEAVTAQLDSGELIIWPWAMTSLIEVLLHAGEPVQARERAQRALAQCHAISGMPATALLSLQRVLALAEAQLGDMRGAAIRLEAAIARAEDEFEGIPLGQLYEARAQVALLERDPASFEIYERLTSRQFRPGRHPALMARCQRLLEEAQRLGLRPAAHPAA